MDQKDPRTPKMPNIINNRRYTHQSTTARRYADIEKEYEKKGYELVDTSDM